MPPSPRLQPSSGSASGSRPPIAKRSSTGNNYGAKQSAIASPASLGEQFAPRQHNAAAPRPRHAKIVLPRNHSSGRNLAKLGKAAQAQHHASVTTGEEAGAGEGGRYPRRHSHEGDAEIRLPGSLDENRPLPMRRNMTAYQLSRNTSHTKLKKNLSHGQLSRLQSGRNLAALGKAPPSPGLRPRYKRPKSAEMTQQEIREEKNLHEQEVELLRQQRERKQSGGAKTVGFAIGSAGSTEVDDALEAPNMEDSGVQDDEWTDQSASVSPYSTRQNTATNSRRESWVQDKPPDRAKHLTSPLRSKDEAVSEEKSSDNDEAEAQDEHGQADADGTPVPSPEKHRTQSSNQLRPDDTAAVEAIDSVKHPVQLPQHHRSPLHAAKDYPMNPATRRLLERNYQLPAPALVSNVSALDDMHSMRGSPAPSMRSARSTVVMGGDHDQDELVSRFISTAPNHSTPSGANTTSHTPKQGSLHTPEEESAMHRAKFHVGGPISPGSTVSGSSGAATPSVGRSRTELRGLPDRSLADREGMTASAHFLPFHIYDRRNETLKSYLNLAGLSRENYAGTGLTLGPEIFQGRFKAVNTELKVVQKFRDPVAESVARLRQCKDTRLGKQAGAPRHPPAALKASKSAVTLSSARPGAVREPSKLSTSASPPKQAPPQGQRRATKPASAQEPAPAPAPAQTAIAPHPTKSKTMPMAKSAVQIRGSGNAADRPKREVSFAGTEPEMREYEQSWDELGPDAIARQLWESVGA